MGRFTCAWAGVALLAVFAANQDVQAQTTWYVDDDAPGDPGPGDPALSDPLENGTPEHPFDAIQEGIDAAGKGDTVLVRDGTYTGTGNKELDYGGKAITVRSENGPGASIIDCEGEGRGFLFANGEGASSVIDGLTITKGSPGAHGGGVYCLDSSPTIANCIITENAAGSSSQGGGIACRRSAPTILNCTIRLNTANWGAGVSCDDASSLTIMDCTIAENTSQEGGGILLNVSAAVIARCVIARNRAFENGGGIACRENSTATIRNCVIVENTASYRGGAILAWVSARLTISNVTIVANYARDGGALALDSWTQNTPSFVEVSNSILWNGSGGVWNDDGSTVAITYCNVQGGWPGVGNLDTDPRFALSEDYHLIPVSPGIDAGTNDPPGGLPDDDLDGNHRPLDGDGNGVAVADMGAFEFNPNLPCIALSPNAPEILAPAGGPNPDDHILSIRNCGGGTLDWQVSDDCAWLEADPASGSSVGEVDQVALRVDTSGLSPGSYVCMLTLTAAKAINTPRTVQVTLHVNTPRHVPGVYPTIQAGIDAAIPGDHVVVADGIFSGVGNREIDFHGKAIVVRSENGPQDCIIDRPLWGFWFQNGETERSIVDGFTIRNGQHGIRCVNNSSPIIRNCLITGNNAGQGAGVYCHASSPTISNCTITGNGVGGSPGRGGGIFGSSGSHASIVNCVITDNTADSAGGGIAFIGSNPTISFCTISRNSAGSGGDGGGIYCYGGSPVINNCEITSNTVPAGGGGGLFFRECVARISDCVVTANDVGGSGGGIYCLWGDNTIVECWIAGNSAGTGGGVAGSASGAVPGNVNISKSTITGNTARSGGGVACGGVSFLTLTDSLVIGNLAETGGGVSLPGFIGSTLTRCIIMGNTATTTSPGSGGGGLRIGGYSAPTIDNCVIAQNSSTQLGGGIYCEYFSTPTISNCTIAGNTADVSAGGVYGHPSSRATITNGIIAGNDAGTAPEIWVPSATSVTVSSSTSPALF